MQSSVTFNSVYMWHMLDQGGPCLIVTPSNSFLFYRNFVVFWIDEIELHHIDNLAMDMQILSSREYYRKATHSFVSQ